ncbi:MAG: ABC transporter ATP-binding protein [Planctomycetota bacterium]
MSRIDRWFRSLAVARRFSGDLAPHRWRLAAVGGFSVLVALFDLLKPWPIQWIFDGALMPAGEPRLRPVTVVALGTAALLVISVLRAVFQYQTEIGVAEVGNAVTRGMRFRIFSRLAVLSPAYHAKHKSGDLLVRLMGDVPMVTTMIVDSAVELATRALLIAGTVAVMFYLDPLLTLASFVTIPLLSGVVRWISNRIHVAVRKQRKKEGTLADFLHESIAAADTIQALGGSRHVIRRFARQNRRTARAGLKAKRLTARLAGAVESLLAAALAIVLALGAYRVLEGRLTPGELLVFVSYVRSLTKPVRSGAKNAAQVAKGTACGERILDILEEEVSIASAPGAPPAPAQPAELSFERVSFAYEDGTPALAEFTARFRRGELSALAGRSGAGKSTASLLAARIFDPAAGRVCFDGRSIAELDLESVRARVGLCMQKSVLFGESLRENLLLARPDATDEELWRSLREAGAEEFVLSLSEGLETNLGAGGVGLSGGQQSRISLARTLLRDAPILIVDEPFAGLDRPAAAHVAATLEVLARERIVIVIAHDLANLESFDRIVFLERGVAVATGRHAELARALPEYLRVVRTTAETGG